jgi:PIN domain nuclease of toxin-antitoxin system
MDITIAHALWVESLPLLHRDPFDRLLVAQGLVESMPILSSDALIAQYAVPVLW